MGLIRLLFLADTHLGVDFAFRPRVERRRRGEDFFVNYKRALEPARRQKVDAVIHGGDLLFRSRVPARLVDMAFAPLKEIADKGIQVYLVPGNHERSQIPYKILSLHPNIHIFDRPRTFLFDKNGSKLALAGFPYWYHDVRNNFAGILQETRWQRFHDDCQGKVLCVHHCFEGATVGPGNYTFRYNDDVIRLRDIPKEFMAVFSGHIHRFQVLKKCLNGRKIQTPVYYPGSIERTSFAERDEKKGYLLFDLGPGMTRSLTVLRWEFVELPARPMVKLNIKSEGMNKYRLKNFLTQSLQKSDPNSVVKLYVEANLSDDCLPVLRAASLRDMCPKDMNISVEFQRP